MYWHVHTNLIGIFFHIFFMSTKILFTEIASYLSFIFNFWSNGEKNDGHVLHYIVLFHFFLVGYCKFQYFFSILQNTTDCYSSEGNYKLWEKTTSDWLDRLLWRTNTHTLSCTCAVIILYLRNIMKCKPSFSHPKKENNRKKDRYWNCRINLYFRLSDESCKKWKQSCEMNLIYSIKSIIQIFLIENIQQSWISV